MTCEYTETVFQRKRHYTDLDIPQRISARDYTAMEFGANLKRYREAKDLNQGDLGEIVGVAQATIQRWENGKREPKHEDLEKLARALDVSVADLFREDEGEPVPSADDLADMIQQAMGELPLGVSYEDYPTAVASGLHERLMRFRAVGGLQLLEGEGTAPGTGAQPRQPTKQSELAEPRTP